MLLQTWIKGDAAWVQYVAMDESGKEQTFDEVPEYTANAYRVHLSPTRAPCLQQHIWKPRRWSEESQAKVSYEAVSSQLVDFLVAFSSKLGLPVTLNPFNEFKTEFIIGSPPPLGQKVEFHGTHFCALENIFRVGLRAVTCQRKGEERAGFGNCIFSCAEFGSALRWSQFVEVRQALGYAQATGWFVNAVIVVAEPVTGAVGAASFEHLQPLQALISLKMAQQIEDSGGWISPHWGCFVH